ncbi:MAG: transcriptional regulator NrdR [Opitutaceae bacterium]|jgi:transcriptional repressor NrdR|nr:transcriptional regulator NrdR [Opitutaceae bacterium]
MRCPKCTSIDDKVLDSRISREGNTIRRRRECQECHNRFTTIETLVREDVVVIKHDGRRQPFDRDKLVRSVRAACHKRPIDAERVSMLVDDVMDILEARHMHEIPSHAIGEGVMEQLRKIDHVAYVRFASVYKEFRDVSEFVSEIQDLDPRPDTSA